MKKIILSVAVIAALSFSLQAQEIKETKISRDNSLLIDQVDTTASKQKIDTTIVRIGQNKELKVINHDGQNEIVWGKGKRKNWKDRSDRFDGHWEGIDVGFNSFAKADYSAYNNVEFMSLNQGKSLEFDFNFYELNIGLCKNYVGLVSGLGFSFNNYRFENPFTIKKETSRTEPVALDPNNLAKTKLAMSYLNVPLLLEFQVPVNNREDRLFLSAGIVGGVKIGSHTKVKYGNNKEKDRSGFNINSFNYAATARIGYKGIGLFAKYSLTPFFENGKGPNLTPFTVGLSFTE